LYLTYLSLLFSFTNLHSQTLTITNISGSNSSRSGININGRNVRLSISVQIDNPGFDGTLNIFSKRNSLSFPIEQANGQFIFGFNTRTVTDHSFDITLNASDFNATGGELYAEFENQGGSKRRSGGITVNVIESNTPEPPRPPRPASPITSQDCRTPNLRFFSNDIRGAQTVLRGDTPVNLRGSVPSLGNLGDITTACNRIIRISYQWYSSLWENGTYRKIGTPIDGTIGNGTSISYRPGPISVTRYYRREATATFPDGVQLKIPTSNIVKVELKDHNIVAFPVPIRNNQSTLNFETNFKRDRNVKIEISSTRVFFVPKRATIFEGVIKSGRRRTSWNIDRNIIRPEHSLTLYSIIDLDTNQSIVPSKVINVID